MEIHRLGEFDKQEKGGDAIDIKIKTSARLVRFIQDSTVLEHSCLPSQPFHPSRLITDRIYLFFFFREEA